MFLRGREEPDPCTWGYVMSARAVEMHIDTIESGSARLEIVSVDDHGDRFVIDLVGPEADVRAEAAFLADQFQLAATA